MVKCICIMLEYQLKPKYVSLNLASIIHFFFKLNILRFGSY
jgi:hypothetical protein